MNYGRVHFGFEVENKEDTPSLVSQVHGNTICRIDSAKAYEEFRSSPPPADGVLTALTNTEIYIFTADCVPLLFFTESENAPIAAVHCGWRGAAAGIAAKALSTLQSYSPSVHVIVGPCISGPQYEVKEDFVQTFLAADPTIREHIKTESGKMHFDVSRYVLETQLRDIPSTRRHLEHMQCTFSTGLPSYRRTGSTTSRIRSWIRTV